VIHILFASIWGHWIGQAHLAGRSIVVPAIISFAAAALLHGLYDFVVILNARFAPVIAILGILSIWLWRLRVLRAMHEDASQER
jgi:RsiW-degrading membrane proteinase PrsW (M82 family)